jgi:hypothetical protein
MEATGETISLKKALQGPAADRWTAALAKQLGSFDKYHAWEPVLRSSLPPGTQVLHAHPVCKIKFDLNGRPDEHKVRIVVNGSVQDPGGPGAYYAPVATHESMRQLLAFATANGMFTRHADVSAAFLQGIPLPADKKIYVHPPPGVPNKDEQGRALVLQLLKAVYGLREGPLQWWVSVVQFLVGQLKMLQCSQDRCVFAVDVDTPDALIVVMTVDDAVYASYKQEVYERFESALKRQWDISHVGPAELVIGIKVVYDRERRHMVLSQRPYIERMCAKFNLTGLPPKHIPMSSSFDPLKDIDTLPLLSAPDRLVYAQMTGVLTYLAHTTRLELHYSVNLLASYRDKPNQLHMDALRDVFAYVQCTSSLGLCYSNPTKALCVVRAWTDASFGGDRIDRHSKSGGLVTYCGAAVISYTFKQDSIALSTAESETLAMPLAAKSGLQAVHTLKFMGAKVDLPLDLNVDNQPAIYLVNNVDSCKRTKHIDIKVHWLRERVQRGDLRLVFCPTAEMAADIFTKALPKVPFRKHRAVVLGCALKPSLEDSDVTPADATPS